MGSEEVVAYLIFGSYFGLILLSGLFVGKSLLDDIKPLKLLESRPFLLLRIAVAALGCTWYFMIEFMRWSHRDYAKSHPGATFGSWLNNTALFEQAWTIVSTGPVAWWWSSWICTWTVVYTAIIWLERGARRGIRHRWAYMLLGQLVAMSVSTSLFLAAMFVHPPKYALRPNLHLVLVLPLIAAMGCIAYLPRTVHTSQFMPVLLALHALLLIPFGFVPPLTRASDQAKKEELRTPKIIYKELAFLAGVFHQYSTAVLLSAVPPNKSITRTLYDQMFSHPAQASISFDVIWVSIILLVWALTTGSTLAIVLKLSAVLVAASAGVVTYTGVNWSVVLSTLPIVGLAIFGLATFALSKLRSRNAERRKALLAKMGIEENVVVPGTSTQPPRRVGSRTVIGFWHPYCNAGGGGERVLWAAIRHLQKVHADAVVLVYTGDYPKASKEEILAKVDDRFSIKLESKYLEFIPLPSRQLVDGSYWRHFTLLGQSLSSVYLAWEGLCGVQGFWGDIFLDSMGYSFTWPFVRLVCGPGLAIGAYVHYPTVSSDMVKRVRERSFGVENAGAAGSGLRTRAKLLYYHILTSLYATSLLFSQWTMTNSSWTSAHITSLVSGARRGWLSALLLLDDKSVKQHGGGGGAEIVYPPCDTSGLRGLGNLDKRKRQIISLAQFRPEKDHARQLYALARLFEDHPEYRNGPHRVTLTLAGGARDPTDEARVDGLRALATKLGIEANVEFLLNAPYSEIVRRLGDASIGINTMQDEHFGINVVEFMAAGLIPVVHASAGPLLDIVVPYQGQRTGFHAKSAEEFAQALHDALSLGQDQAGQIRRAARSAAEERFSEEVFVEGFEKGYQELVRRVGA